MILADKIIEERKRCGWSQEDLAERLDVSRQSVSKWEGAQSVPDLNRIIQMADLFGVSTDYLLKDEMVKEENRTYQIESESNREVRKVSMEEASEFIRLRKQFMPSVANGVSLCIWSSIVLVVLAGLSVNVTFGITEGVAALIGLLILMSMIAIGVFLFVKSGNKLNKYDFLEVTEIDTEYGVDGMAKEKRAAYEGTYNRFVTIGVILCVLCSVPLICTACITEDEVIICSMVGVLLLMVGIGVNFFIRAGWIKESYDMLLQEGDYTPAKKAIAPRLRSVSKIYWMLMVAIFLAISFISGRWDYSWIVWPIAGVLYAPVTVITKMILKAED